MRSRLLDGKVLFAIAAVITFVGAIACGSAEPHATPVPASEIAAMVKQAVAESVPAASDPKEIQQMVEAAVQAGPGVSKEDMEAAIRAQAGEQMTAADVKTVVDAAIAAMPAPTIDTGAIRPLVEQAVRGAVPEGVSAAEISRLVEAAVAGATSDVPTRGELEASIAKSVRDAAAGQLAAADVQRIVDASVTAAVSQAATEAAQEAAKALTTEIAAKLPELAAQVEAEEGYFSYKYEGALPTTFREAPMLAALVSQGELPALAERLPVPEDVLVIPGPEGIGKYGGTWRRVFMGPGDSGMNPPFDRLIRWDSDGFNWMPNVAKDVKISDGGKVFTIILRRGMKWSDGAPLTAADFEFAWNDVLNNTEITASFPGWLNSPLSKEPAKFERVDDYTVRYTFDDPYYGLISQLGLRDSGPTSIFGPSHYLKLFHQDHASAADLDKRVADAGLDNWVLLYRAKGNRTQNTEMPVAGPWVLSDPIDGNEWIYERNPYYFAVDSAGNQLPYIDEIYHRLAQDLEVANLRAASGEVDMQARHMLVSKLPILQQHKKDGNYRIIMHPNVNGSDAAIFLNQGFEDDEEIAKWLRNREFRIAMSLALDRQEIGETLFLGIGSARNFVPDASLPYYPGFEYEFKYTTRDLGRASQILDDIGLDKKDADGFRLRTDGSGERLRLVFQIPIGELFDFCAFGELTARHWAEAGLQVDVNCARGLPGFRAHKLQMTVWETAWSENPWNYPYFTVPMHWVVRFATRSGDWYLNGESEGIPEPSGSLRRLQVLYDEGATLPILDPARVDKAKEIFQTLADEQFVLGTWGLSPAFRGLYVVKNNFRNVPARSVSPVGIGGGGPRPETYFFSD